MKLSLITFSIVVVSLSIMVACSHKLLVNKTTDNDGYKLVWSDEFNKDARPDTSNWNYENGFVRNDE